MFEELIGQIITNVKVIPFNSYGNYERIEFWFSNNVLKLSVDNDTDEIMFSYLKSVKYKKNRYKNPNWAVGLEKKILKGFWIGKSDTDSIDLFILGLEEGFPRICIYSAASQLSVSNICDVHYSV